MTASYYANVNPELLAWTPLSARDVLEVGCGEGALAAAYKLRNPRARYTAVETHGPAAETARGRVDRLVVADFMSLDEAALAELGEFDAIVLGDVLEHLPDPWAALRRLRDRLRPDGWLGLSVPNVSHWSVLAEVMSGRWPARDSGLFDRTHLRWFTLDSLRDILADAGLETVRARPRLILGDRAQAERWLPELAAMAERLGQDRRAFEQRARALQWVSQSRRSGGPPVERLHVHFAAYTPAFLDVRMRLPFEAMQSDPTLTVSYAEKSFNLPALPPERPKVAVLQRLALADMDNVRRYLQIARAGGWALVFEVDDHPELIGRVQGPRAASQLMDTLQGFHALQTSTPALARELGRFAGEVAVFPNAVWRLAPPRPPRDPGAPVRVFHGALNREGFTSRVAQALGPALRDRADVEFVVLHDRAFFDALPTDRKRFHAATPYDGYLELMAGCDVVLSPLEGLPAERFKSDVKFLEAASTGVAMIASPCVYADTLEDGRTGLLAPELDDWPRQLARLLDDAPLRERLGAAARAYVEADRMLAYQVAPRADWYRRVWRERERLDALAVARVGSATA